MTPVPILFRDWWDDGWWNGPLRTSRLLMDQRLGNGIFNDDLFRSMSCCQPQELRRLGFGRPWTNLSQQLGTMTLADKDKFQINLDVQQFTPNEITVKTVDNTIVVEGKHEERQDEHGFISRKFLRRYVLSDEHDPNKVFSSLSSDGVLTITAPKKALPPPAAANERIVPITKLEESSK